MLCKPLLSAVVTTCLVGSALAADLPSRKAPPPAPYISPVAISSWTGFYVGVNAGGTFNASSNIALTPSLDFGPFPSGFAAA
ncbi:MAG: outer rane immunogenic protein, partial [Methylobacteriaceae bacterium]|nr:outer rane immunogenic protein [Methylobacteriaceae bacterium]